MNYTILVYDVDLQHEKQQHSFFIEDIAYPMNS